MESMEPHLSGCHLIVSRLAPGAALLAEKHRVPGAKIAISATDLRQETAGFIFGEDAYKDPAANRSNLNPEAFRDASSLRVYGIWTPSLGRFDLDLRPFLRHTDMKFLQHFLPGQPLEENGHASAGIVTAASFGTAHSHTVLGLDLEWSDMFLEETQSGPTQGSAFLQETRPEGRHYDYTVESLSIAPFVQSEFRPGESLTLGAGLRLETPIGSLRLDVGFPIDRDPDQDLYRIHLAVGHTF